MNFSDTWATDADGNTFVFTVEMKRRLSKAGLPIDPTYLPQLGAVAQPGPERDYQPERERRPERDYRPEREQRPERDYRPERRSETAERPPRERPPFSPRQESRPAAGIFEDPSSVQIDAQSGKYIGRMKWYNPQKGYGFIARGGGQDIFFHKTSTLGDPMELEEGQWVLYDVEEKKKGPEATDVEPFDGEAPE